MRTYCYRRSSVVCLCVCLLVAFVNRVKTAEPIEMPFGQLTHMGPRNNVLDKGQDRTNSFASARGDKSAMRFFAKLLWTLVTLRTTRYRAWSRKPHCQCTRHWVPAEAVKWIVRKRVFVLTVVWSPRSRRESHWGPDGAAERRRLDVSLAVCRNWCTATVRASNDADVCRWRTQINAPRKRRRAVTACLQENRADRVCRISSVAMRFPGSRSPPALYAVAVVGTGIGECPSGSVIAMHELIYWLIARSRSFFKKRLTYNVVLKTSPCSYTFYKCRPISIIFDLQ